MRNLAFYLKHRDAPPKFDVLNSDKDVVAAFAWRASYLTFEALRLRDQEKASWNSLLVDFWRLSTAHSQASVVKNNYDALQSDAARQSLDRNTADVVHNLFQLFAFYTLENAGQEFFSSRAVSGRQLVEIRNKAILSLMERIRPHAVRLVDSWQISDFVLDSSLGRADGNVYPDLFYRASQRNPLNGLTVDPYPNSKVLIRKDETAKYSNSGPQPRSKL
jgi:acyl-CoA oxidase